MGVRLTACALFAKKRFLYGEKEDLFIDKNFPFLYNKINVTPNTILDAIPYGLCLRTENITPKTIIAIPIVAPTI